MLKKIKQKNQYDVAIVGAGPAGLFAAWQLTKDPKKRKRVLLIEKGKTINNRGKKETMCGVGGAGTYSDGKLHFTPVLSHEKLLDVVSNHKYLEYIDYVDKLFTKFGVEAPYTPENINQARQLVQSCQQQGIKLYLRKCRHVGSDKLPKIITNMVDQLKKWGAEFVCTTEVEEVLAKDNQVIGLKTENKTYQADNYLLAPGRVGAKWLQTQAKKLGLNYSFQKVEIGVRVEFPAGVMAKHSQIMHENIYSLQTPTYDDTVRTFCPCPNGRVALEEYGDYISVNGYSNSSGDSPNSNFNLTTEVQLTDPIENTTDYAILVAKTATLLGGDKPLLQRLADLRAGRRSTWARIEKSYVTPSLTSVTPGDISLAMPHRTVTNILEGLEILDRVLPGLNSPSTLIYAPEIKLRGNRLKINNKMQSELDNLFVAGDGPGTAGNIVGAAVSGIFAAQGILSKAKQQ